MVIIWLPASGRFYCSLASLPEGGRGKAINAETQTSAFCYLVTVLVNDGTRGEGNWSCRVPIAIWTISQKCCWPACLRLGSGWGVVSDLGLVSLARKDGIKSIGHSCVWKSGWPTYTYDYCWNTMRRFCLPTMWPCKVEGGMRVTCGHFYPKFFDIQDVGQKYIVLVWHSRTTQLGYFFFTLLWGSLRFRFSFCHRI